MLNNSDIFNRNIVNSSIDKDILSGLNMGYSIDDQGNKQMTTGYANAIEKLANSYREATAEANALKMAQNGLAESTIEDILAKQNWSKAEIEAFPWFYRQDRRCQCSLNRRYCGSVLSF